MSEPASQSHNVAASSTIAHDYGWDVGTLHVIDWYAWLADLPIRRFAEAPRALRTSLADWSR